MPYCREYLGYPDATNYYANVIFTARQEVIDTHEITCGECDGPAYDCMYCTASEFCEDHMVRNSDAEVYTTPFTSDVNWVTKQKA